MNKFLIVILRISLATILIAKLFHVLHWPYGNVVGGLETIAVGVILIAYCFRFYLKENKGSLDMVKLFMVVFWVLTHLLPSFYSVGSVVSALIAFFCFFILVHYRGFWKNAWQENSRR